MTTATRSLVRAATALVVGLLLAIPVVLTTATPAHACRCAVAGIGQQARSADIVVSGTVLEVRDGGQGDQGDQGTQGRRGNRGNQGNQGGARGGAQGGPGGQRDFGNVTLVVGVDRIYSGRIPDPTIEITTAVQSSACGLGRLPTDERYFFFLTEDATTLRATSCGGTGPATRQQARAVTSVLGEGRGVDQVEPPTVVERTVVGDPDPTPLALVAAPGGVLAGVGLLGLVVLGGLGARSRR